jgi:hypothetical protein
MRMLIVCVALAAFFDGAVAGEKIFHSSISMRVGETKRLGIAGGHKPDCVTSISPEIDILRPPTIGALSQRAGVSYVAQNSISGTCDGARLFGTEVDYTAKAIGSDVVQFDAVFQNGRLHYDATITVH